MYTTKTSFGNGGTVEYRPEVPFLKQPKVHGEKIIKGVRYYLGEGKIYVADLFDQMFKTVKTNIKGKEYKGVIGNYDSSFE